MIHSLSNDEIRAVKSWPPSSTQFLERLIQTVSKLVMITADAKIQDGFDKAAHHKVLPKLIFPNTRFVIELELFFEIHFHSILYLEFGMN